MDKTLLENQCIVDMLCSVDKGNIISYNSLNEEERKKFSVTPIMHAYIVFTMKNGEQLLLDMATDNYQHENEFFLGTNVELREKLRNLLQDESGCSRNDIASECKDVLKNLSKDVVKLYCHITDNYKYDELELEKFIDMLSNKIPGKIMNQNIQKHNSRLGLINTDTAKQIIENKDSQSWIKRSQNSKYGKQTSIQGYHEI